MYQCFEAEVIEVKLTGNGWFVTVEDRDGEIMDAILYSMYGSWAIPPMGSRVYCSQLNPSLVVAMNADNFNYRPEDLKQNEVVNGNFVDNVYVKYTKDSIDINSSGIKNINIKSTDTNIESKVSINGNVTVDGDFKNTGLTELGTGGQPIARVGDSVQVIISGIPYNGTITSGGQNKSV